MSDTVGGTNVARCLQAGHNRGAAYALRTILQRTQHFGGGLKISTWVRLRRAATSRPASFYFSQVKKRCGAPDGLKRKLPPAFSAILLFVGSVGWCWPALSELRSAVLVSPTEASIHPDISHCQRLNRCRGKASSKICGKLDPFSSSAYAPSANPHVISGHKVAAARPPPGSWLANGVACRRASQSAAAHRRNPRQKSQNRI